MLPLDLLVSNRHAGVAELADAQDSGSCEDHTSCGFKSHLRQSVLRRLRQIEPSAG